MTVDSDELRFRAGDVIEVIDMVDKDWWCGKVSDREGKVPDREGWFPSAFVMVRYPCLLNSISILFNPSNAELCRIWFAYFCYNCKRICIKKEKKEICPKS